jgi:hypothetical protein
MFKSVNVTVFGAVGIRQNGRSVDGTNVGGSSDHQGQHRESVQPTIRMGWEDNDRRRSMYSGCLYANK